jgi:hypothetical protein
MTRPCSYNVEPRFGGPRGCWSSWTVRPMGGKKGVKTFSRRRSAILFAMGLRHCRWVFVHTLDGTVQYVKGVSSK